MALDSFLSNPTFSWMTGGEAPLLISTKSGYPALWGEGRGLTVAVITQ